MEVFKDGSHGNYSKQHESFSVDTSNAHRGGGKERKINKSNIDLDGKHRQRKKSKSYNSPKKTPENQGYPQPMMYPNMSKLLRNSKLILH